MSKQTHNSCLVGASPTMGDIPDQLEQRQGKKNKEALKRLDVFDQLKTASKKVEDTKK